MTTKQLNDKVVEILKKYNISKEQKERVEHAAAETVRGASLSLVQENASVESRSTAANELISEYMSLVKGGTPVSYQVLFTKLALGGLFKPTKDLKDNLAEFDKATRDIIWLPDTAHAKSYNFKEFVKNVRKGVQPYVANICEAQHQHLTALVAEYGNLINKGKLKLRHGKR